MIEAIIAFFSAGGWCAAAIGALSVVLYFLIAERFFATGLQLNAVETGRRPAAPQVEISGLRRMALIRAGIAAAPLLGLLGTVTGMIEVFGEVCGGGFFAVGIGGGVSKALLTTQYGLAVAAPALLAERVLLRRRQKVVAMVRAAIAREAAA